jgi:hypothetical protein
MPAIPCALGAHKMADSQDIYEWSLKYLPNWSIFISILLENCIIFISKRSKALYIIYLCVILLRHVCNGWIWRCFTPKTWKAVCLWWQDYAYKAGHCHTDVFHQWNHWSNSRLDIASLGVKSEAKLYMRKSLPGTTEWYKLL